MAENPIKKISKQSWLERNFEYILWNSRFCVLLAVVFGLIGAISLFILGSIEVVTAINQHFFSANHPGEHGTILIGIIGAVDLYLIAIVVLLFSFGIYELFISKIDIGRYDQEIKILEITSLDQLKNKILKVIIMVLIVSFFKRILSMHFDTALEMLYFALSILAISSGVFLMRKEEK